MGGLWNFFARKTDEEDKDWSSDPTGAWKKLKSSQNVSQVCLPDPASPPAHDMVRFVCMSDTHNQTHNLKHPVPDGDVFLHAGDFTFHGSSAEALRFNNWLGTLPHRHKVVIAGNHEVLLDKDMCNAANIPADPERVLSHAIYLHDSAVTLHGIKIYGAPWTPEYHYMAFNLPRGEIIREKWSYIPADTDILMTHGPPLGYGDLTWRKHRAGCLDLLSAIQTTVKPSYHVFGHIHEGYGATTDGHTVFVNAATCDVHYEPNNPAIVFDVPLPEGFTKPQAPKKT